MLFADVETITLSTTAAGALGSAIGAGIAGAAKILVSYLKRKDNMISEEIKGSRNDRKNFSDTIVEIHREAMTTVHGMQQTMTVLNERLANETGIHVRLDNEEEAKDSRIREDARQAAKTKPA